MDVTKLNRNQLTQLKQHYLCERQESVSWGELAAADTLISDAVIFEEYAATDFTEDDFSE